MDCRTISAVALLTERSSYAVACCNWNERDTEQRNGQHVPGESASRSRTWLTSKTGRIRHSSAARRSACHSQRRNEPCSAKGWHAIENQAPTLRVTLMTKVLPTPTCDSTWILPVCAAGTNGTIRDGSGDKTSNRNPRERARPYESAQGCKLAMKRLTHKNSLNANPHKTG